MNPYYMRLNYYTPCQKLELTLGTGPHYDPASLTVLHQDCVSGLHVFVDDEWYSISPNFNSFMVNMRHIYGKIIYTLELYKKVIEVVNNKPPRKSHAFFLYPYKDKKHHRADTDTLQDFQIGFNTILHKLKRYTYEVQDSRPWDFLYMC
ncbi:hypothetical protein H5410_045760 [Solanum commersonii]|uniref:Fe2OG dioxygenase domain-containing protein n=1 Tax=Solanum commersonii TaxID=4109 RepID=A0A9J5XDN6_SOLCO|nr:hypothetical protein H5410_045760 [Solanum commersonii]